MSAFAFAIVLGVTALWVLLPLIPALRELMRPTDAEPLQAVGHDAGELPVFARGFRDYLARQLPAATIAGPALPASALPVTRSNGVAALSDGTSFVELDGASERLREVTRADGAVPHVIVTTAPMTFPGGETFLLEVLARDTLTGGPGAVYRALLAERNASLGERTTVLRWVHAEGDLRVGADSTLYGRASAGGTMRLEAGVTFQRVRAERVVTGVAELSTPVAPAPLLTGTAKFPEHTRRERTFTRVDGDFTLASGTSVLGSLLVTGTLRIEDGARIAGSVKSHGDCVVGDDVTVDGAVIARGSVSVGSRCALGGPVISENDAFLGEGSAIGRPDLPASLVAQNITLASGSQVFGAVSAREMAVILTLRFIGQLLDRRREPNAR